jgi:hypothetical protein
MPFLRRDLNELEENVNVKNKLVPKTHALEDTDNKKEGDIT